MTRRVCLSMIVRNEARVIERCLDAARPVIDAVTICDTGSTDDTIPIARRWLKRAGIPGRLLRQPFVDFAHNRTRALRSAVANVKHLQWDPALSYLLFLDADMELRVAGDFRRDALTAAAYRLLQRNGSLRYPNVRLVRADVPGHYVGATHEYLALPGGTDQPLLESLAIDDRNDGGSRADKYARDRRLLEAELALDPKNLRALFYLAQTYRGLGEFSKALVCYRKRAEAGGWSEEAWYALYTVGLMLLEAGADRAARRTFIAALRRDPRRPEPYFHLACLTRGRKHYVWSARFARAGLAIGVPADRSLFVDLDVCHWGFLRELSVSGYHAGLRDQALEANELMTLGIAAPPEVAATALDNSAYHARPLAHATYAPIAPVLPEPFRPCNPSILRTADGYLLNCRTVSYRITEHQQFVPTEPDGILRTRNVLLHLDRELRAVDETELAAAIPPLRAERVQGLEDCRLFATASDVGFTCSTVDLHPAGPVRMSVVTLEDAGRVRRHRPLQGYGDDRWQKNWLPFVDDRAPGELRAIYGYEPLVVLRVDPESGACEPVVERKQGRNFDLFRGSAGPVDLPAHAGGGRLVVIHSVAFAGRRYYLHRFLRVDDDWRVTAVSRPFYFRHLGIEFACGACLAHDGDLLITFGVEDREAWLCRIPLAEVCGLLRPLPDWPHGHATQADWPFAPATRQVV
jgi:tetratricopeptide (TPR) repeat protein